MNFNIKRLYIRYKNYYEQAGENLLKKRIKQFFVKYEKYYSQYGEDVIINAYWFKHFQKKNIFYLDIGSGHPKFLSNTYFFYKKGNSGICVDANNILCKKFHKKRSRDIIWNYAVTINDVKSCCYYKFNRYCYNTTNKNNVNYLQSKGLLLKKKIQVNAIGINELLEKAYNINNINFLSIDIEGQEFNLIKAINFDKYRPEIICIEALDIETGKKDKDTENFIRFMAIKNYSLLSDTNINLIFKNNNIIE